jgi:manganese/zinc/iron transport system permease protein
MVGLAALFGAISGVSGAFISSTATHVPTGPTVVLCISAIAVLSLVLAPNRGLLWNWLRQQRNERKLRVDSVLSDLYVLAGQHKSPDHGHSAAVLQAMSAGAIGVERSLQVLEEQGLAHRVGTEHEWAITPAGMAEARRQSLAEREVER